MPTRTLAFLAVAALTSTASAQTTRIDGASAGFTIGRIAVEEFQKTRKDALRVLPGISGTGGGLRKLCGNEIDIANAARPIFKEELSACQKAGVEFIELPIAFDAVTVVVNPRNGFVSSLSVDELKTIWAANSQGKIVRWSQVNPRFPDAPLKLLGPDSRYEQTSLFTEAILGRGQPARRDYTTSVDDSVLIQGVARDANTLSYLPYATYLDNRSKLKLVPIASGATAPAVSPSFDSIANGSYALLVRPLFLYVNVKSLEKPLVREFVEFALVNAESLVKATHYLPLTEHAYKLGLAHVRSRIKGSTWDGSVPVGVTRVEVEKRLAALERS
jgi:phosphate transport system substrate-binding protein